MSQRLVVGISGASGVIYGIRLLEALRDLPEVETHLVLSAAAKQTIAAETDWTVKDVEALAHTVYDIRNIGAAIASGSFVTRGMVVIPCSVKTLSGIAQSFDADLLTRAADVTLKEGRPLVLVVRETPLHLGHLRSMMQVTQMGAVIFPPVPAYYGRPRTLDDIINGTAGRVLARLGFENDLFTHWQGMGTRPLPAPLPEPESAPAAGTEVGDGGAAAKGADEFLSAQTTLTLSTVNPDGSPYACDLFYVRSGSTPFYFLSDPKTVHVHNLLREPRVSATVHGASKGWQDIRGMQLSGEARRVEDTAERARAYALYIARYAFVGQWIHSVAMLGQFHKQLGVVELYKLTPHRMRWIDNTQGFGHKEEWQLPHA